MDGMIYASAVRSAHPRAIVKAIHKDEALSLPGVVGVFTAEDIPGQNKVGHLVKDWDTMIPVGGTTHYLGDAICIVAAETQEILEKAKRMVQVEYEVLTPVRSPQEAMAYDAPLVHRSGNLFAHKHIQRGNAALAIARSKHVLTRRFYTPYTEHAFLEPECAVAYPDGDGVMILSTDQGAYDTQHETAPMLGLPFEKVKVKNMLVGGGFGGKEDVTVQHLAALVVRDYSPIRVSRSLRDTAYRVLQCRQQLTDQNGREPSIDEIAQALDLPPAQITAALDAITAPVSLYEPVYSEGGDTLTVMDQVRDRKNTDEQWIESITLREAISHLSEREKRILALRFEAGRTQMEVAGQIGISQAQVSRLEKSAIRSIRKAILPS